MDAVAVMPMRIVAALICGGLLLIVLLVLAVVAYTVMRRNADGRREMAELREENARLRRELERLKGGQGNIGSTAIEAD
jgi:cell division protein FtsB